MNIMNVHCTILIAMLHNSFSIYAYIYVYNTEDTERYLIDYITD